MKDIETLLNKYFEGETTCEEERRLRRFLPKGSYRNIWRYIARCSLSSKRNRRNFRKSPV